MAEWKSATAVDGRTEQDEFDALYGLSDELVREVGAAVDSRDRDAACLLIEPLHAADIADLIERLPSAQREAFEDLVGDDLDADVYSYLDESVRKELIEDYDPAELAEVINELDSDDAVDLIEDLDEEDQQALLRSMPAAARVALERALAYPEDSAGRLMRSDVAFVPSIWTVGETIDFMRSGAELPDHFYCLVAVGPDHRPVGLVMLSRLLRTKRPVPVTDLLEPGLKQIPATMDQEDVAFLFRQYGLVEAPVVDEDGRLVGVITVDDVVDVIEEEHEEDILAMAGLSADDFYEAVVDTTRARGSWLAVNLLTAILASVVIGFFQAEIEKVVALAVLMPIVASMGGNAGTQTLTVAVRALAMKELRANNAARIVVKEVIVGGLNGLAFAAIMGGIAYFWFDDPLIGWVIAAAMVINLLIAGLAGTLIPLALDRVGMDPATGSSVVLTTVTDVVGFLCFLGLATVVLF